MHILSGGATNRVAEVEGKKLEKVSELPSSGWLTRCFTPRKSALYVMQIEDEQQKFAVKFRVVEAKPSKVVLEWLPFTEEPKDERGTQGQCGGAHECS